MAMTAAATETKTFGATSTTDDVLKGVNLAGKRVLVTGVSAGLGVETARALAAHGAEVVGAARVTDGVDRGSKESLQDAIETAQRADTLVYSILFADKEGYGNSGGYGGPHMGGGGMGGGGMGGGGHHRYPQEARPDGKKILEQMSKETGGVS